VQEANIRFADVEAKRTKSGNTRWVVRSEDGEEYTTFRPEIGRDVERYRGKDATIKYHEEDRGGFHNVYLDSIAPPSPKAGRVGTVGSAPDAVAWHAAVQAGPWLVGSEHEEGEDPKELYERLRPFKDLVAKDIRESTREHRGED
jgi:hypothetical protein